MKTKKILPRGKYMLVRQDDPADRKTSTGLIIPDSEEQEKKSEGTVEAVSKEISDVKQGDKVVFGAFAGETLKVQEGSKEIEYKLLHDDDVIAFVK